jgi:hypothetical protein
MIVAPDWVRIANGRVAIKGAHGFGSAVALSSSELHTYIHAWLWILYYLKRSNKCLLITIDFLTRSPPALAIH